MSFLFKLLGKTYSAEEVGTFDIRMGRSVVKQVVAGSGLITEKSGFTAPYNYMSILFDDFLIQITIDEVVVRIYADEEGFITFNEFLETNPEIKECE